MLDFEQKHIDAWINYQNIKHNSAKQRIEKLSLMKYSGSEKSLLDLGANQGHFGMYLADHFKEIICLEPVIERPNYLKKNMRWIKDSFGKFTDYNLKKFDVVFSFAMTMQVKEFDGLNEDCIAERHFNLVDNGGVMIYESQKLEERKENLKHVSGMVEGFRKYFGKEIENGSARTAGGRLYFVFMKNMQTPKTY